MDWRALGIAVVRRRVELGFEHRKTFAQHAELGERNLSDIEHGRRESYDAAYLAKLERALRWPLGTVDAILNGLPAPATVHAEPAPEPARGLTNFGAYLMRAITAAGYTPTTFAREADLSPRAITSWAYGQSNPRVEDLSRIAPLLNVPAEDLIARAAEVDGIPTGMPIPGVVAEFLDLYWLADEAKQQRMLEFMGHVNAMLR